jgi:pimeloyl-ACP methyl ester carboxylesterase
VDVAMSNSVLHTVPVHGGDLAVGVWGPDDAPQSVLLVHGVTASHLSWPLVAEALPGVRVIAPDLRGRGRSNALPGPYGMPQHADDLAAVLDHFGVDRIVVVGHSMGAFVSVVLAHRHPARVAELILVDGGLPLTVPEGVDAGDFTKSVLGPAAERLSMTFPSREAYAEYWRQHPAFPEWTPMLAAYVDYDLQGEAPHLQPATAFEAVAQDSAELTGSDSVVSALTHLEHRTTFLRAPRGLQNAEPLYQASDVAAWTARVPGIVASDVDDVNHYTIVMGEHGAGQLVPVIREALARESRKVGA